MQREKRKNDCFTFLFSCASCFCEVKLVHAAREEADICGIASCLLRARDCHVMCSSFAFITISFSFSCLFFFFLMVRLSVVRPCTFLFCLSVFC